MQIKKLEHIKSLKEYMKGDRYNEAKPQGSIGCKIS